MRLPQGVFITFAKKNSAVHTPTYDEVLDVALAYSWIDRQAKGLDDNFFLLTYTPRRSRSPWSQVNREKVEAMIVAGTMKPAGLAAVELAKANGRWEDTPARPNSRRLTSSTSWPRTRRPSPFSRR